jgi:hypothetical protein
MNAGESATFAIVNMRAIARRKSRCSGARYFRDSIACTVNCACRRTTSGMDGTGRV